MDREFSVETIGEQLGLAGADHTLQKAEGYCEHERQRIKLTNQAKILTLRASLAMLREKEQQLSIRLQLAPPPGNVRSRRWRLLYYASVTLALTIAGFFFTLLALDPFQLGGKSYLYCLGIAVVTPFLVEKFLETWANRRLIKTLASLACLAALVSLILLAVIRGDLLMQQVKDVTPVVDFAGDEPAAPPAQNTFYEETLVLLRLVMALLALAMELGAGLALRDAWFLASDSGEDPRTIGQELEEVRHQMVNLLHEMAACENEAAIFVARFWRDFYRSLLTHTVRGALTKVVLVTICVLLLGGSRSYAASPINLVVAIDLTRSVAVQGHDSRTEFGQNVAAVGRILAQVPAGSHVAIIGITDQSFTRPYILMDADISSDEGYFKERLSAARGALVARWRKLAGRLRPTALQSDILGACLVASQLFRQMPPDRRKQLIVFSDMRQATGDLDLEKDTVRVEGALSKVKRGGLLADLNGVEVRVFGADAVGKSPAYWRGLQGFWVEYFKESGARLSAYSALRAQFNF